MRTLFLLAIALQVSPAMALPKTGKSLPPNHPPLEGAGQAAMGGPEGTILETMDAGNYTYLRLKTAKSEIWAAIPQAKLKKGQKVSLQPGMVMDNFESKSLKRTFKEILFSGGLAGAAVGARNPNHSGAVKTVPEKITVEKAKNQNAYTVTEIYQKKSGLAGKTAVVRGKVVKLSPAILGVNWVHLQDGTGNTEKGTHDLVVTTQETPTVGAVATFTGTVAKDKDFGMGYFYSVLIERATLLK